MIISRIVIQNFCGVEKIDLAGLTHTTLLTGPNGVGKTTILNALLFAFGFDVRDANGTRIKNGDLVGPHGDSASVHVQFEHNDRQIGIVAGAGGNERVMITDIVGKHAAFLGAKGIGETYAALYEFLGMDPRHVECALSPRSYLLGPDLGMLLAELCAGKFSLDDLKAAAGDHWGFCVRIGLFKNGHDDLDAAGKRAFDLRRDTKKIRDKHDDELKSLGSGLQCPTKPDGTPMTPEMVPVVKEALDNLRGDRDRLLAEKAVLEAGGTDRRAVLEGDRDTAKQDVDALVVAETDAEKDYDEARRHFETADQAAKMVLDKHAELEAIWMASRKKLADLEGDLATCPTCGYTMTEDEAEAAIALLHPLIREQEAAMNAINITTAKEALAGFSAANDAARERLANTNAELKAAQKRLATIEAELAKIPKIGKRSLDDIQTAIETTEERIAAGEKKLPQLIAWSRKQELEKSIAELEEEIGHLNWCVKAFKDGEFLKARIDATAGGFEERCNARLIHFGYSISIHVEGKAVNIMLQRGYGKATPIARCSKAELVLAGYAVATAFEGCSTVCIDDLDAMFTKTKATFLAQMKKWGETRPLFASGAWTAAGTDMTPIQNYLPGAKVVWVGKE